MLARTRTRSGAAGLAYSTHEYIISVCDAVDLRNVSRFELIEPLSSTFCCAASALAKSIDDLYDLKTPLIISVQDTLASSLARYA